MRRIALFAGALVLGLTVAATSLSVQAQNTDADYDKLMKSVGAANGAFRKSLEGMDAGAAKTNLATLHDAFTKAEAFWKAKGKADAQGWSRDARVQVETIQKHVADAKWDEVKAAAGAMGKMCQTCHMAYREKAEDGTFRIKPGA